MTLFPAPPKLGVRQQAVYDALHALVRLTAADAGALLHAARENGCECRGAVRCRYARGDGRAVLESLRRRGLCELRRPLVDGRRVETWVLPGKSATAETPDPAGMGDDIPF